MTVGEALSKIRSNSSDRFGEGPNVTIVEGHTVYQGTCSYFIFNGAYDTLREKKVMSVENNVIYIDIFTR